MIRQAWWRIIAAPAVETYKHPNIFHQLDVQQTQTGSFSHYDSARIWWTWAT